MTEADIGLMQLQVKKTPRTDGHNHKPGRGKEGFYPESQREHGPAYTLTLDV